MHITESTQTRARLGAPVAARFVVGVAWLALVGCGGSSKSLRPVGPVEAGGVKVQVQSAKGKRERLKLDLRVINELDEPVQITKNQLAIVIDGQEFYHSSSRPETVGPRTNKAIKLSVKTAGVQYDKIGGVFVRLDGIYKGESPIGLPPLVLGEPTGQAGQRNASFTGPTAKNAATAQAELEEERARQERKKARDEAKSEGFQQYKGSRKKIRNVGIKCAAMPLRASNVPEQLAFVVDEILLGELQQVGFEAIGPDDVNALVGFETVKDAVGCDDASCISEIGNALGVPYLASGNVANVDGATVVTLKLIDVQGTKVLSRVNRMAEGGTEALPRVIAEAVQELVDRSQL